jgi:GNAT superfamily N-acetyltransferase
MNEARRTREWASESSVVRVSQLGAGARACSQQMDSVHPSFPLWYLPLTGVDPPAQGRGLGSSLLRHGLEAPDREGLPAYLEATSPRSRDLYARHGFEAIGVVQQGGSPPMWPMPRQPR